MSRSSRLNGESVGEHALAHDGSDSATQAVLLLSVAFGSCGAMRLFVAHNSAAAV